MLTRLAGILALLALVSAAAVAGSVPLDADIANTKTGPLAPAAQEEEYEECGGVAPDDDWCTTGVHLRQFDPVSQGIILTASNFTGTVETRLIPLTDPLGTHRVFQCHLQEGELTGPCDFNGQGIPGQLTPYLHICRAYEYRTETPGGNDAWSCYVNKG